MKKIISIFLLVIGIFSIGGCSSKAVVTDVSSLVYLDNSNNKNIAYNLSMVAKEIKSVNFSGDLIIKGKKYNFSGEAIIKETIENSLIHIKFNNNNFYLKNGNVYLSYFYNNTNVIIKDDIDSVVKETIALLKDKGVKCSESKIYDILKNKNIEAIDYEKLSEKLVKLENGFGIYYKNLKANLNDKYLLTSVSYSKKDFLINVNFGYPPVSIKVPLGYDLINMNVDSIKDLLKIDNISELIK
jgi:hypothetical protein